MHIHILGVCGTFMGGLARLAIELGHTVTGADANPYPPMSDQLRELGIPIHDGYDVAQFHARPDLVVIGNRLTRGNEAVEYVLEQRLPYTSGPAWLAAEVLPRYQVIAIAGTHGKTTTSSLIAWILETAGHRPGFLIGGVPQNFGVTARLGAGETFVIEADEYDTAFFDKRSKFVHYHPQTLVINNLEFDHADIFDNLAAIQRQFHHLIRTLPRNGRILCPTADAAVEAVLEMGCWTPVERFGAGAADWTAAPLNSDFSRFTVTRRGAAPQAIESPLFGRHNAVNALAAIAAANTVGISITTSSQGLGTFLTPKRRLETIAAAGGIQLYDDFAHHPTAIRETLAALRSRVGAARIIAVLEARSNTMRSGILADRLGDALRDADRVFLLDPPELNWNLAAATSAIAGRRSLHATVDELAAAIGGEMRTGDHIIVMSNGGFGGLRELLHARIGKHA